MKSVLAVYISLGADLDLKTDPEIGLFQVLNTSTGRQEWALIYAEDTIYEDRNTDLKYATGFIPVNGIGTISESGNFKTGGGIVNASQVSIVLNNSSGLRDRLAVGLGVNISGKYCYIVEYSWDSQDVNKPLPLFAGRISQTSWDETQLKFTAVNDFEVTRRGNMSIDGLPVTFGELDYAVNKRVGSSMPIPHYVFTGREEDKNTFDYEVTRWGRLFLRGNRYSPSIPDGDSQKYYMWVGIRLKASRSYTEALGAMEMGNRLKDYGFVEYVPEGARWSAWRHDCFCVVTEGLSAGGGAVPLMITDGIPTTMPFTFTPFSIGLAGVFIDDNYTTAELDEVFFILERPLLDGIDDNMPNFVRLVNANIELSSDGWVNTVISSAMPQPLPENLKLTSQIIDDDLQQMNIYGDIEDARFWEATVGSNQTYSLQRKILLREIQDEMAEEVKSYRYLPASNIRFLSDDNLSRWDLDNNFFDYTKRVDGSYTSASWSSSLFENVLTNVENMNDCDIETCGNAIFKYAGGFAIQIVHAIVADLPSLRGKNFDSVNLSIVLLSKTNAFTHFQNISKYIKLLIGGHREVLDITGPDTLIYDYRGWMSTMGYSMTTGVAIINHLDSSIMLPVINSLLFPDGGVPYDSFLQEEVLVRTLGAATTEKYNSAVIGYRTTPINANILRRLSGNQLCIMTGPHIRANLNHAPYETIFSIYEIGVTLEYSIGTSELLMPTNGRLFASTWEGRRNEFEHIRNPVDVIEMCRRLSNWSETKSDPDLPEPLIWGKEYPPNGYRALIDTGTFDSDTLTEQKQLVIGGQFLNENDANTDTIVKKTCESFFLISKKTLNNSDTSWIGQISNPYETICGLGTFVNGVTLSQDNIISYGALSEPSASDVYCEPSVKYNYVEGLGYKDELSISNITSSMWCPSFVKGFTLVDGEDVWNMCKKVYNRYRHFSAMQNSLSEQPLINSYDTALWYIKKLITWMQKSRITVDVSWETGRAIEVGSYVSISLPHIFSGVTTNCVVEGIRKSKGIDRVALNLILICRIDDNYLYNETDSADVMRNVATYSEVQALIK